MRTHPSFKLARTLAVCASSVALAIAGAYADDDDREPQPGATTNDSGRVVTIGSCVNDAECADGDVCTRDYCDPISGCRNDPQTPTSFCSSSVVIPDAGNGVPYPSTVDVSGVGSQSRLCSVTFRTLRHTFPDDIDALLVGPTGEQNTRILSDVGGSLDVVNIDLTFKDAAAVPIPDDGPMTAGTFKPSNVDTTTDAFPAPAPPASSVTALSNFSGDLNGTWSLFVVDDGSRDSGTLGAWCLNIVTGPCGGSADCDDGNPCNGTETCVATACQPGTPIDCDDANPCTTDRCVPTDGSCAYSPTDCGDGDGCTVDFCDPSSGCEHPDRCVEFCNAGSVALPDTATPPTVADPYPTTIDVSLHGYVGTPSLARVKLNGITHTFPDDLDMLLVGPRDQNAILLSDVGGSNGVTGVDLVLTDGAALAVSDAAPLESGTFRPSNFPGAGTEAWPAPAAAPSGGSALSAFTGVDPNGPWSLYIVDDSGFDSGTMAGGWCLSIVVSCSGVGECDDEDPCTDDGCVEGHCQSIPSSCDDGDACTADTCDAATGCVYSEIPGCRCDAPEPNPHARGYWKRLCQGPHSGDELTDDDASCVAGLGDAFAEVSSVADICAVLNGSGNQCTQGGIELMTLALNLCHQFVCHSTDIGSQYGSQSSVGASYHQADGILSSGGDCLLAQGLSGEINTGRALSVDTVSFAKRSGGGARVTWTAMGGGTTPVLEYNVWRRQAGSLSPFAKIGGTTSLFFDDTTPGNFEYEVTPVR